MAAHVEMQRNERYNCRGARVEKQIGERMSEIEEMLVGELDGNTCEYSSQDIYIQR